MADPVTPPAPTGETPPPAPVSAPAPAPAGDALPPSLIPGETPPPPADPKPPETPPSEKPPETPPAVVPEKYDFSTLQLPEGVTLNSELMDAMAPVFKESGLTQDAANKLVKAHAEKVAEMQKAFEKKADDDFNNWMADRARTHDKAIRADWGNEYDANFGLAQKALARFFQDADFYKVLDETGLVRHPTFMRGLLQVGRMIREDTPPPPGGGANVRKTDAEIFYGSKQ